MYADKTKLSTFGTKKGYPVIARCANLPIGIRNGYGLGGGRVVGWLPVVCCDVVCIPPFSLPNDAQKIEEDASESRKPGYVNFKRVVWHKSFYELLASIRELSKTGYSIECADGVVRHIYPAILILSADYEEQYDCLHYVTTLSNIYARCFMALIRGTNSKFPCPVCLVPGDELCKGRVYALRTTETMEKVYDEACQMSTASERNNHLKGYGLRYAQVCSIMLWLVTCLCQLILCNRMCFGSSRIQTHTELSLLTACMHLTLVYSKTTSGLA